MRQTELEFGDSNSTESGNCKIHDSHADPMAEEVHFDCPEHQVAFHKLNARDRAYIAAYVRTGTMAGVAEAMGLKGSVNTVRKMLRTRVIRMGVADMRELRGSQTPTSNETATVTKLMEQLERQDYRCALSGVQLTPDRKTQLDHCVPVADGGTHDISNLQWVDENVNRAKGTMAQDEFIQMCRRVAEWTR